MSHNDLLQQGITALKAGRKAEARTLLTQVVRQDKHNEKAWLWLSGAVDTDAERRACLEKVLVINPHNDVARRGLAHLQASTGARPSRTASPPTPRARPTPATRQPSPAETSALNAAQGQKRPAALPSRAEKRRFHWMMGLGIALGVLAFALAIILAVTGGESQDSQLPAMGKEPHVVVYGRQTCSLTRRMLKDLERRDIPHVFKSIDDQQVSDELYPRLWASGHRGPLELPVVDVNGQLLIRPKATTVVDRYEHP